MNFASYELLTKAFETNVLHLQEAKDKGKKVIGQFCLYTPSEIALAANAIPVSLCGTRNDSIPVAEEVLPRSLCPLIKSSFGFALQDSCPYLAASDLIVADATCDGKKKMYELLQEYKPLLLLQLPQEQSSQALQYWENELKKFVQTLEKEFDITITEENLSAAIHLMNRERYALKAVMDTAKWQPSPLTGVQLVEIAFKTSFFPDKELGIHLLTELAKELTTWYQHTQQTPETSPHRILLTGVPVGLGSHKVIRLVEECGGRVVCLDNCSAYKKTRIHVSETENPYTALAKGYLDVPCAVMSPNPHRYTAINEMAQEFAVDAIIDLTWTGCQTYAVESWSLKKYVQNTLHIPFLQIETDYSETDTEQLKVRIEAFLEMI